MVRVNNTLVCGAIFFQFSWFSWPPTHYRVYDKAVSFNKKVLVATWSEYSWFTNRRDYITNEQTSLEREKKRTVT